MRWIIFGGMAYTLATTAMFFARAPDSAVAAPAPATPSSSRPRASPADLSNILQSGLFGLTNVDQPTSLLDEPAVETRLPLKLLGVFVTDAQNDSAAIIAEKGKPEQLYLVGQTVSGRAVLRSVHPDHVVLLRAGVHEALRFPKVRELGLAQTSPSSPAEPERTTQAAGNAPKSPEQRAQTRQALIREDPDLMPDALDGELPILDGGYPVGSLASLRHLSESGLREDDLILSVNGRPMHELWDDQPKLVQLLANGQLRIEVQRDGRRMFVTTTPDI